MRHPFIKWFMIFCLTLFFLTGQVVWAEKYRIGYIEGGHYPAYKELFNSVMKQMGELGWADKLEFVPDACLSAGWDRKKCREMAHQLAARKDLDMIWSFGTWAGQEIIKTSNHTTPIIVMSVSNAVKSGIVPNYEDSGRDNLTTRINPKKFENQLRMFYNLFRFKRLGFVYADTPTGRTYADMDTLKKLSKELGFELAGYGKVPENKKDAPAAILKGVKEIAPKIDAYYITICIGFSLRQIPGIMAVLNKYKIPTMPMYGADYVKAGSLITICDSRFKQRARFTVAKIIKILQGAKPRDFPIVFEPGPRLAINLAEAKLLGWDPPIDILGSADHIYMDIVPIDKILEDKKRDEGSVTVWDLCGKKSTK